MKMYAACLASYNNGTLHGEWFDLEDYSDAEELLEAISEKVLKTSPSADAEEWAAHDYEGEGLSGFGEYPDLEELLKHVQMFSEHGDAWVAYVNNVGEHYATEEGFSDSYMGEHDSPEDWAEEFLSDTGALESIPENLRYYFDFAAYARDARMGGDVSFEELNGSTYVFSNH